MNTLFNFSKKGADISVVLRKKGLYLVFSFRRLPHSFLKRRKIYCAKVNITKQKDYNEVFTSIKSWLDSISTEYLHEQLCDAPTKYLPIIEHDGLIIDFNASEDDVMILQPFS